MLLCGIIDELKKTADTSHLLAYFFCQATDNRLNNAIGILRGLIYLLVKQQPLLISHVQERYEDAGKALFEDVNAWSALSNILDSMLQDPSLPDTTLVIDALDECETDLQRLLDLIVRVSATSRIKWLVSSRNRTDIEQKLRSDPSRTWCSLELKSNAAHVSHAVAAYIDHCISGIPAIQDDVQLQAQISHQMQQKADGTFLWVGLVAQELKTAESWHIAEIIDEVPAGLQELYSRMMRQIEGLGRKDPEHCFQVLSTITATYRPLCLEELGALSGLPQPAFRTATTVAKIVKLCGSFLTIREDRVFIIHQSARDFLYETAKDVIFSNGIRATHYDMFSRSLGILSKNLRRNICNLKDWGVPTDKIQTPHPDPLAAVRYSCIHWVDHLAEGQFEELQSGKLQDGGIVDKFLQKHYLHWLEAISILKNVSSGTLAMLRLNELFQVSHIRNYLIQLY